MPINKLRTLEIFTVFHQVMVRIEQFVERISTTYIISLFKRKLQQGGDNVDDAFLMRHGQSPRKAALHPNDTGQTQRCRHQVQ